MLLNKNSKSYIMRSDKPNENWTDEDLLVVDDNSELAQRIINAHPYYDFVIEEGKLVDIVELEKPPEPPPKPDPIEQLQQEKEMLELQVQTLSDRSEFLEEVLTEVILTTVP